MCNHVSFYVTGWDVVKDVFKIKRWTNYRSNCIYQARQLPRNSLQPTHTSSACKPVTHDMDNLQCYICYVPFESLARRAAAVRRRFRPRRASPSLPSSSWWACAPPCAANFLEFMESVLEFEMNLVADVMLTSATNQNFPRDFPGDELKKWNLYLINLITIFLIMNTWINFVLYTYSLYLLFFSVII